MEEKKDNFKEDEILKVVDKRSSIIADDENVSEETRKEPTSKQPTYVKKLLSEIEEQKKQLLDLSKAYRNLQKDSEDFRIRLNKDVENRVFKGKISFFRDLLEILDNIERGIESAEKTKDFDSFLHGIKLVETQFLQKIEKHDIKEISSVGVEFDPKFHDALSMTIVEEKENDNKITEVVEKGYLIKDEVLRPSKVIVGKFEGK